MLTAKEIKEIKGLVKSNTLKTIKDVIKCLESEYTDHEPMLQAYKGRTEGCISPTRIKDTSVAKSSDFEKKHAVKVMKPGMSSEVDDSRGRKAATNGD